MRANVVHRGLVHLWVTGAVLHTQRTLTRWAKRHGVRRAADFDAVRDAAVTGEEVGLSSAGRAMLDDLEGFLEAHVRRGRVVDRVDGHGRRVLLGLFAAYHADPLLLDDHVLLRFKQRTGARYLRDLGPGAREAEVEARYRREPRFARLLVDHLASMTDAFALLEHRNLMEMGAIPIPSAEQLRRERGPD